MENPRDACLLKGIEEFNRGLFFECHETLEEIWLEEHGHNRQFYQGIIQIAAGYFKWEQKVPMGTIKLFQAGLEKLNAYGPIHHGVNVHSFVNAVQYDLAEIKVAYQRGMAIPRLRAPHLSLTDKQSVE